MSNAKVGQTLNERRAYWRGVVERAEQSGQPPREFCLAEKIDLGRFYHWRRALAVEAGAGEAAGHFALVRRVASRAEPSGGGLELEVMRGWRLRIPPGVDAAALRAVLAALAAQA
jgi:hypothetical protein